MGHAVMQMGHSHAVVTMMQFTRMVFRVLASPFLLNATIDDHVKRFEPGDQQFVSKFLQSIYADDVTAGEMDVKAPKNFTSRLSCILPKQALTSES